jgi:hypothetical protein
MQGGAKPLSFHSVRKYTSPRLLMPNNRSLPPVLYWRGTSPSQAASAPSAEDAPIANGAHQRGGRENTNAGELAQEHLRAGIGLQRRLELAFKSCNLFLQGV